MNTRRRIFQVHCPSCLSEFPIDSAKLPEAGVAAICSACLRVFPVHHPPEEAESAPPAEWESAAQGATALVADEFSGSDEGEIGVEAEEEGASSVGEGEVVVEAEVETTFEVAPDEPEVEAAPFVAEREFEEDGDPGVFIDPFFTEDESLSIEDDGGDSSGFEVFPAIEPVENGVLEVDISAVHLDTYPTESDFSALGIETPPLEVEVSGLDKEDLATEPALLDGSDAAAGVSSEDLSSESDDAGEGDGVGADILPTESPVPEEESPTIGTEIPVPEPEAPMVESTPPRTPAFEDLSSFTNEVLAEDDSETASPSVDRARPAPEKVERFGRRDPHERARHLARVLVSDIIAYYPVRYQESLSRRTLQEDFADEIQKSYREYVDQVGIEMAESTPYFVDALNHVLGRGEKFF